MIKMKFSTKSLLFKNSIKLVSNETKIVRKLCLSLSHNQNVYQKPIYRPNSKPEQSDSRFGHPFDHLFEWKSLKAFAEHLVENIVYFDGELLALSKPWGVGTHKPFINVTEKNSHLSQLLYSGSPKYSIQDSVEMLSQILDINHLKIVKTIDRFMSGIVLLVTNDLTENKVLKSMRRSMAMEAPAMHFWCVTKGWPIYANGANNVGTASTKERVGIKLLELDELGDHKQPIIIPPQQLTNNMRRRKKPQSDGLVVKPVMAELLTLALNKTLAVSLVELSTNITKYNFIECYLAYKTSFVLGDCRFSRQVKHVLGSPLTVKPDKLNFTQDVEPLSSDICSRLRVRGNAYIPVLIHHKRLVLPLYLSKKSNKDLVIETNRIPNYFDWSLNRLGIRCEH